MLSIQQKLEKAEEYKALGNECFKEGQYGKAKASYGKCLAYCTGLPGSERSKTGYENLRSKGSDGDVTVEEDSWAAKLELICHQNIATCFLKMEKPSEAIHHCNKALKLDNDGSAWKAQLRKGEAYLQMGRHDDAKDIFETLLQGNKDDSAVAAIKKLIAKANKLVKVHNAKEKQRYKNMFSQMSSSGTSTTNDVISQATQNQNVNNEEKDNIGGNSKLRDVIEQEFKSK